MLSGLYEVFVVNMPFLLVNKNKYFVKVYKLINDKIIKNIFLWRNIPNFLKHFSKDMFF